MDEVGKVLKMDEVGKVGEPSEKKDGREMKKEKVEISYGLDEVTVLKSLIEKTNNKKIKSILESDLRNFNSKLVTKVINDSFSVDIPPLEPAKTPFNDKKYFLSKIRGYEEKVEAVRACHPNTDRDKIIDLLIRCNGNEEETIIGLFSNELPPYPSVPKKVLKKHNKKFKQESKVYKERKKAADRKKPVILLTDLTSKSTKTDIRRRIEIVEFETENVNKINSHIQPYSFLESLKSNESEYYDDYEKFQEKKKSEEESEKYYMIGEKSALIKGEPVTFKMLPERVFSNEVTHAHFRVAESQFHRMTSRSFLKVDQVRYLVTPELIKKFESFKKSKFHKKSSKKWKPNRKHYKQYLLFSPHNYHPGSIDRIRLKNYHRSSFKNGRLFSSRREICDQYLFENVQSRTKDYSKIVLSLVVTKREIVKKIPSFKKKKLKKKKKKKKKRLYYTKKTKGAFGKEEEQEEEDIISSNNESSSTNYKSYFKYSSIKKTDKTIRKPGKDEKDEEKIEEEEEEEDGSLNLINGEFDSIVDPSKDTVIVFNPEQVLPIYIVSYSSTRGFQNRNQMYFKDGRMIHLADEWTSMKHSAKADKQQQEIKKNYLEDLERREQEQKDKEFIEFYENYEMKKKHKEFNQLFVEKKTEKSGKKDEHDDVVKDEKKEDTVMEEEKEEKNIVFDDDDDDSESIVQFESPGTPEEGFSDDDDVFDSPGTPAVDDFDSTEFEEDENFVDD